MVSFEILAPFFFPCCLPRFRCSLPSVRFLLHLSVFAQTHAIGAPSLLWRLSQKRAQGKGVGSRGADSICAGVLRAQLLPPCPAPPRAGKN